MPDMSLKKNEMPTQAPEIRAKNFLEVATGYTKEQAMATLDLLNCVLADEAQGITSEVGYAPLPDKAKELSAANLKTVTYDGTPILQ